jgi:hypothetical protein cdiviTM7_01257
METYNCKDTENSVQDNYERYLSNVYNNLYKNPENVGKERDRSITYVPYRGFSEKLKQDCPNIHFTDRYSPEISEAVSHADVIINIARGEEVVEAEINHPDRNVKLPPESLANTEMVGDLYLQAIESGNTNVQVVHTGRMNNRTIAMATAMPILAESAGINCEDVIHTSDVEIRQLVEKNQVENQVDLKDLVHEAGTNKAGTNEVDDDEVNADPKKQEMQICARALRRIYEARKIDLDTASSSKLTDALLDEYNKYPRISTSTLMKEQMLENVADQLLKAGKSADKVREIIDELDAHTDEEPDSVDTVTNFTNSIPMILANKLVKDGYNADEVGLMSTEQKMKLLADSEMTAVIVADIAHMPRVMWLADYLMPDNFKLTFIESRTGLSEDMLQKSMEREERSFGLGSNWLSNQMGTRNPAKVGEKADNAYWGRDSISNDEINKKINEQKVN